MTTQTSSHTGRPTIDSDAHGVWMLCPQGHLVASCKTKDWAGSLMERNAGNAGFVITCHGA